MHEADPITHTMTVAAARAHWSQLLNAVVQRQQRVVLEKDGIPVAALVTAADLARLKRYDAELDADFAVLDRIGAAFADVPAEELEREVARALAEVRAELRVEREQAPHSA